MKKYIIIMALSLTSIVTASDDHFFCQGNKLIDLYNGHFVREVSEDTDLGGCSKTLAASKFGYFCNGEALFDLRTGTKIREVTDARVESFEFGHKKTGLGSCAETLARAR